MQSKRILFIIRSYSPDQVGGGAKSVQTLAEGLTARGHEVHVLRLAPKGEEEAYQQRAAQAGITGPNKPQLHVLPIRNIYWPYDKKPHSHLAKSMWHLVDIHNPFSAYDLRKFIKKLNPDLVNTSIIDGFSPSIFSEVKRSGAKLIHTMRDYYLICSRSGMYRDEKNCTDLCRSCRIVRNVNRVHTRHVDLFLSNSKFVADTHRYFGAFGEDKPCAVQWNVNDRPLSPQPHLPPDLEIVFGYIGRLAPTKGVERLIDGAAQLASGGRPWRLLIAGDGMPDYVEALRKRAAEVPQISFLGWTSPEDFYSRSDVVICPSVYNEPLPRVIYEAYGFARPVIASRVGGNPEVVVPSETGALYDGEDVAGLVSHMEYFRALTPEKFTAYSINALKMGAKFTPAAVIDQFEVHMENLFHKNDQ